jgi:hypothetical protein
LSIVKDEVKESRSASIEPTQAFDHLIVRTRLNLNLTYFILATKYYTWTLTPKLAAFEEAVAVTQSWQQQAYISAGGHYWSFVSCV